MNETGLPVAVVSELRAQPMRVVVQSWRNIEEVERKASGGIVPAVRALVLADLYYLLVVVCGRRDMLHPWVYARVRQVEASPDGFIDLWAREHFKSSIITFGLTISDILHDPDETFGIFSHTRPIAKAFLRQIMRELEANVLLHAAFPDVLWGRDVKQAPKWSEDDGIIVKRASNPNEATIEAWGLVDGQPTSKHFGKLLYDDLVTEKSVTTPEMIDKTTDALAMSYNLGKRGGKKRIVGTFYHFGDSYRTTIDRGTATPRIYPATDDGTDTGKPVLLTQAQLDAKRRDLGPYIFSCQMLLSPAGDKTQGFKREWLRFFKNAPPRDRTNNYVLFDPASSKKKGSDYTSGWAVQLGLDGNYYCTPICRDRLNLTERATRLFKAKRDWQPMQVRYEKVGLQSDIEHFKSKMEAEHYRFDITEVGGQTSKTDRIKRLIPLFEQGRVYLPKSLNVTDWEGKVHDLVHDFVETEFCAFPVGMHDDMMDALARICEPDLPLVWPKEAKDDYAPPPRRAGMDMSTAWMG